MGALAVMGRAGDTKVIWDASNPDEVAAAKKTFDDLRAKGFLAYRVKAMGAKGDQIFTFDPEAEKIILAPPLRGGR
jgi:hypothetical protein